MGLPGVSGELCGLRGILGEPADGVLGLLDVFDGVVIVAAVFGGFEVPGGFDVPGGFEYPGGLIVPGVFEPPGLSKERMFEDDVNENYLPRAVARALIGGGGGGEVYIHIFVFCPTNFF